MNLRRLSLAAVSALSVLAAWLSLPVGQAAAWELPEGRVYEMVSPPYKADYGAARFGAAPNGDAVWFSSLGAFAGATSNDFTIPYVARRGAAGWQTSAITPPLVGGPVPGRIPVSFDFSPDLSKAVIGVSLLENSATQGSLNSVGNALILSDPLSSTISYVTGWPVPDGPASFPGGPNGISTGGGGSPDLSHVFFTIFAGPEVDIAGVGGPEPVMHTLPCDHLGGEHPESHPVSTDASAIFMSCGPLYGVINDSVTLQISSSGTFRGASSDGSKVFFTDNGALYMALIDREPGHEAVTETVPITPGASASVLVSSDDGSHVYFTSAGVLTSEPNAEGNSPVQGASNLYVYDTETRETGFIAVAGVGGNSVYGTKQAQTTPDGRFLVFETGSRLTPNDLDTAVDVYRYDASAEQLLRVSAGEGGADANGNDNAFDASIATPQFQFARQTDQSPMGWRAISDNGSTIVFSTQEPLSPRALNGKVNVYAWHDGRVGMISTGLSPTSDDSPVLSASGRDVFFRTSQGILPQDVDGVPDVYDARIEGGFPQPSVPPGGCSGDACQGPPSVPQLLTPPTSATFSGRGNPVPPPKPRCRRGHARKSPGRCVKSKGKKAKRSLFKSGGRG